MPNKVGIDLDKKSFDTIAAKLQELESLDGDGAKIINTEAKNTVHRMQRQAPRDTGRLIDGIDFIQTDKDAVEIFSEAIDPETKVDYAPIQEHGLGVRAQPYFWHNVRLFKRDLFRSLQRMIKIKLNKNKFK